MEGIPPLEGRIFPMTSNLPCCKLCKALRIQFNHYLFVEVMMSKFRMCLIVPLLLLALSILYDNTVLAQEPIPPSDMVITGHSRLEWVTEDNNKNAKQVFHYPTQREELLAGKNDSI